jgi:hypothetical protein
VVAAGVVDDAKWADVLRDGLKCTAGINPAARVTCRRLARKSRRIVCSRRLANKKTLSDVERVRSFKRGL